MRFCVSGSRHPPAALARLYFVQPSLVRQRELRLPLAALARL
ncbi:MAG: hypothetical protein AABZ26_05025 [Chloroflexota bacterium]